MLIPLMLPKILIITIVVLPVDVHEFKKFFLARIFKNRSYIRIIPVSITVLIERTVTVIGPGKGLASIHHSRNLTRVGRIEVIYFFNSPQPVNRPVIIRPIGRVSIPKLRLQKLSSRVVETASVLSFELVLTTQLRIRAGIQSSRWGTS